MNEIQYRGQKKKKISLASVEGNNCSIFVNKL